MIYQLTPFSHNLQEPFSPLYKNLVLEENPFILSAFPRSDERKALVEYAGLYYCWKNTKHDWIGFTSYRQLSKTPFILRDENLIRDLLKTNDILSWMSLDLGDHLVHTCALYPHFRELLTKLSLEFPRKGRLAYCSYFVMNWDNFDAYMSWSWPYVQKMLSLRDDPCLRLPVGHFSNLGVMIERMFFIWYVEKKKKVFDLNPDSLIHYELSIKHISKRWRIKFAIKRVYWTLFFFVTDRLLKYHKTK